MGRPFLPGSPGHLLYNFLLGTGLIVGAPAWIPWVLLSRKRRANLPDRVGLRGGPRRAPIDGRPTVWVHAVSVGETLAAVPLLRLLRLRVADARLLVSSVTLTGRETAVKSLSGIVDEGFYFPFDLPGLCGSFLDRVRPDVVVIVETEIWPNFIAACARRGVSVVIVNGRLSKRSFVGYMRFRWFFAPILRTLRTISAQTSEDAERFVALGAPRDIVTVGGNLKFDVSPPESGASPLSAMLLREKAAGAAWIVAGSTHDGEEAQLLRAFLTARERNPSIRLLLAPRHPERFDAVEALVLREGVSLVRRTSIPDTAGHLPGTVLLLDTVGELSGAYAAADLAFVGGSLVPKGGHNVLEPAWHGVPTIVGPHMDNFREIADAFLAGDALIRVAGEGELADRLTRFAADPRLFRETGLRAKELLETFRGASEASTDAVVSALPERGTRR
ncbi:3-deoxy-D-manno-octulosonic acid transferase [Candidatus Deferrimicrobium sp.]|uniref:3-deoxy-D-manno-octulosonic acid transferase n=1 Tax=Candidatus Deferrimicrobium sp. TaxID=3060586 RepID=UPI002EDB5521